MTPPLPPRYQRTENCPRCKTPTLGDPVLRRDGGGCHWQQWCTDCGRPCSPTTRPEFRGTPAFSNIPNTASSSTGSTNNPPPPSRSAGPLADTDAAVVVEFLTSMLTGIPLNTAPTQGPSTSAPHPPPVPSAAASSSAAAPHTLTTTVKMCVKHKGKKKAHQTCTNRCCKTCCLKYFSRCNVNDHMRWSSGFAPEDEGTPPALQRSASTPSASHNMVAPPLLSASTSTAPLAAPSAGPSSSRVVGRQLDRHLDVAYRTAMERNISENRAVKEREASHKLLRRLVRVHLWSVDGVPPEIHRIVAPNFPQFALSDAQDVMEELGIDPPTRVLTWDPKTRSTLTEPANIPHPVQSDSDLYYAVRTVSDRPGWPTNGAAAPTISGPSFTGDLTPRKATGRRDSDVPLPRSHHSPPSSPPSAPSAKRRKSDSTILLSRAAAADPPPSSDFRPVRKWPSSFTYREVAAGMDDIRQRLEVRNNSIEVNFPLVFGCPYPGRNYYNVAEILDGAPDSLKQQFDQDAEAMWKTFAKQAKQCRAIPRPASPVLTTTTIVKTEPDGDDLKWVKPEDAGRLFDLTGSPSSSSAGGEVEWQNAEEEDVEVVGTRNC